MKKKELICISCPVGCRLEIEYNEENPENIIIKGNKCPKGEVYGKEEILSPSRVITASMWINSKLYKLISVKTDKPILKSYIEELLNTLYSMKLEPPVKRGDVIIRNFKNTGVNIIATRTVIE